MPSSTSGLYIYAAKVAPMVKGLDVGEGNPKSRRTIPGMPTPQQTAGRMYGFSTAGRESGEVR